MANPFVGEIRMFGGDFAPQGWAFCDGSVLNISEYDVLFSMIGSTYGGDGMQTFALPDLRGRVPMHAGNTPIGTADGAPTVTLSVANLPKHSHGPLMATTATATDTAPANLSPAQAAKHFYSNNTSAQAMAAGTTTTAGGGQPHDNMQPYTAINFIIALNGIWPSS